MKKYSLELFYEKRHQLLDELIKKHQVEFVINQQINNYNHLDEKFRGLIKLTDEKSLVDVEKRILELNQLWKKAGGKQTKRSKVLIPRLIDSDIDRMQIYVNKAHSSTKHINGYIPLGSIDGNLARYSLETATKEMYYYLDILKEAGYLKDDEPYEEYYTRNNIVYIDAECVIKKEKCDLIQSRVASGMQIRVALFANNSQDEVKKYTQSMGIIIIPATQNIEIYQPLPRKERNDSLKNNTEDLIVLPSEVMNNSNIFNMAKLYRRYKINK